MNVDSSPFHVSCIVACFSVSFCSSGRDLSLVTFFQNNDYLASNGRDTFIGSEAKEFSAALVLIIKLFSVADFLMYIVAKR